MSLVIPTHITTMTMAMATTTTTSTDVDIFLYKTFLQFRNSNFIVRDALWEKIPNHFKNKYSEYSWNEIIFINLKLYLLQADLNQVDILENYHRVEIQRCKMYNNLPNFKDIIETYFNHFSGDQNLIRELIEVCYYIVEESFMDFLKGHQMQTLGYENYEYIIKYYKLKQYKNHMIKFTNDCRFNILDEKVSIVIWWIMEYIRHDEFISKLNPDCLGFVLNENFMDTEKEFDLYFPNIKIAIEINTTGDDEYKKIRLNMSDNYEINMMRFDINMFYNIKYFTQFGNELLNIIISFITNIDLDCKKQHMIYSFKNRLNREINIIEKNILVGNNFVDIDLLHTKQICLNDLCRVEQPNKFIKLFELRVKQTGITFLDIINCLEINVDDIRITKDFINYLRKNRKSVDIYSDVYINTEITFNWSELPFLVQHCIFNIYIKEMFELFYCELF
jgi:hypothetical protein